MSKKLVLYFAVVEALAVWMLLSADWGPLTELPFSEVEGLLALIGIGILSESLALSFAVAGNAATSSIGFLPIFATAVLFPSPAAMLVGGAIMGTTELFVRRRDLGKVAFNTAQVAIAAGLGSVVYHTLGGSRSPGEISNFLPFVALALTFFLCNLFFTGVAFSIIKRTSLKSTLQKIVSVGNLAVDLLASPVALIIAALYIEFHIVGVVLVVLPLLVIRRSYVIKYQLEQANESLLKVLIKAIETRDPYTSGHSIRVSTFARLIADALPISRTTKETVETAALLHDIGKIDVQYSRIIQKPSMLSPEERTIIQSHATIGAELLGRMTNLKEEIVRGVRHHHEWWDGSGYPDGLKGEEIPLSSRIIMIADSVDAMLSDRPYRKALSVQHVKAELLKCSGGQFDPDLVATIVASTMLETAASLVGDRATQTSALFHAEIA